MCRYDKRPLMYARQSYMSDPGSDKKVSRRSQGDIAIAKRLSSFLRWLGADAARRYAVVTVGAYRLTMASQRFACPPDDWKGYAAAKVPYVRRIQLTSSKWRSRHDVRRICHRGATHGATA